MIKLIIFDIDGTIVDAYRAIWKSLNYALKKLGYRKVSFAVVKRSIGYGERNFLKNFIEDKDVDRAISLFREHHKELIMTDSRIRPCARKVLGKLRKKGYRLAVASNRSKKMSVVLLRKLGIRKYFDLVECATGSNDLKPKPTLLLKAMKHLNAKKRETLYVGDMALDVKAGRNAGVRTIAVLGGSSSGAELAEQKPYRITRNLCGLLKIG